MFTPPVIPNEHQSSRSRPKHERKATQNTADGISQIDGLLVALNYLDHLPFHVRNQLFKDWSTNPSNLDLPASSTSQGDDQSMLTNISRESKKSSQDTSPGIFFPTGIDGQFIEELRLAMIDQWRRLQTAVEVLNTPRAREMTTHYQNAEGFRNHGLLAFRNTFLTKQAPTELEKLFAMASISYAVSTILCAKEILLKSDILDGIGAWIKRISSEDDRQVFRDIAYRMWQKCRSHLEIPPIEMSAPAKDFTSNYLQPPISFDHSFSGQVPEQSSPIATSSDISYNTDYPNGFMGPYTYSSVQNAQTLATPPPLAFGFNDLGSYGEAPAKPQCLSPYTSGLIGRESVNFSTIFQSWSPDLYGLSDMSAQALPSPEKTANESNKTGGKCQMPQCLRDSKSFCVLRAMFRYLDNSLHRLSGNGMTQKVQRNHPHSEREEVVRRQIMEKLRRPWKTGQLSYDESLQAVKLVTAQFLGWGIIQTIAETRGFIISIGKELVSDQPALASFCNWIASNSTGSQQRVLPVASQKQSPTKRAGASTSSVSKTDEGNQKGFMCDECGAWFRERKNLIRHAKTLPHPRKYKKRERPGDNESSNKRQRDV